jgi:SAM-dependent MidA family methyltransferase
MAPLSRVSASLSRRALPQPTPEALAQSAALAARLREDIAANGGAISFRRYMERVLLEPGLGYYSGGAAKFGPAGDFITAPELSPLFGRCIGRQVAEVLALIGGGEVLELGGGSGALAAAALEELGQGIRWTMLEPSAELGARQRARLGGRVGGRDDLPTEFRGVILANEVADALPVERFTIRDGRPRRLGVQCLQDGFGWTLLEPDDELREAIAALEAGRGEPFPEGYSSEYSPLLRPWVHSLAACLESGLLLLVDYGLPRRELYSAQRRDGTLRCHYRHHAHDDPFLWPGLQDLSAWVDFTAVAEAGTAAGLTLEGFSTQAAFLAALGIDTLLGHAGAAVESVRLAQQAKQLLLPGEMGERFRVIGLSRGLEPPLTGFGLLDLAGRL